MSVTDQPGRESLVPAGGNAEALTTSQSFESAETGRFSDRAAIREGRVESLHDGAGELPAILATDRACGPGTDETPAVPGRRWRLGGHQSTRPEEGAAVLERPQEAPASSAGGRAVWPGRKHVLDLDDFSVGEIEHVFATTDGMKEILSRPIKKVPTLRGKTVVTLFYEASTRTRVSFEMAAKILGADAVNVTASGSSVTKGESLVDTIRTLQATGADMVVMRHPQAGAPYLAARQLEASVLNGGDGWHAHPTQALLDMYTVREHLGRVEGLKVAIVGDVLHSRVARSNCWGFARMGAQVVLCGPPTLMPSSWRENVEYGDAGCIRIERDLDRALEDADVVMALRLQRERQASGLLPSIREYSRLYGLTATRMRQARPHALVMHPGPMNEGVEISPEVAYGSQSVIEDQVTNGVAVRMALLYLLTVHGGGRGRMEAT